MVLDNTTQYGVDHSYGTENLRDVFSTVETSNFNEQARLTPEQSPFLKDSTNEYEEINARLDAMNSASTIANHETFPYPSSVELTDRRLSPEALNGQYIKEVVNYTRAVYAWRHNELDPVPAAKSDYDLAA